MLKVIKTLSFLFLFSACAAGYAQEKTHPIDIWLQRAIDKDPSTVGIREATNQARQMWDKELNRSYQHLISRLPANQKEILRTSQRTWLKFRDADGEVISQIIAAQQGTMFQMTATSYWMELTRARALQLDDYDKLFEGE
ncbi:lysozyme inhibitor LprI family protein [Herbaspirillum robiniae]|nr:lysozyme inhibitor LprI family protein [Herbaspirillum robiniae]